MSILEYLEDLASNDLEGWHKPWRPYNGRVIRAEACPNGHPYTEANTRYRKRGTRRVRSCLICSRKSKGYLGIYKKD